MPDQISPDVKAERSGRLSDLSDKLAGDFYDRSIGETRTVLFERTVEKGSYMEGYTDNYIKVYIDSKSIDTEDILHKFTKVRLDAVFKDGMKGTALL